MASPSHVIVRLRPGSDGDATHIPPPGVHTKVDPPTLYLEKIAMQWMERRGEARAGIKYVLESLPTGYTMWQRPRPGNPKHVDKYLYGHPNHKSFDSPNRFYLHFEHLMENEGNSIGCPCTVCAGIAGVLPSKSASSGSSRPQSSKSASSAGLSNQTSPHFPQQTLISTTQAKGRPKLVSTGLDSTFVDEEGTPDVYRNLINKLRRNNRVDDAIVEPMSPDWRAEKELFPKFLDDLSAKEQWLPRNGELVLYIRDIPAVNSGSDEGTTQELSLYDAGTNRLREPAWEAGVVTQTPTTQPTKPFENNHVATNVIYSGVRVEPMADPNSRDKSMFKRYTYVSLQQIRPFVLWKELLQSNSEERWHPTIKHALTVMSTVSLLGRHRFKGTWPNAFIYCHGMYLGSELIGAGDTVRLLPSSRGGQTSCSDIMVVKSIRLKLLHLDHASSNDYDDARPYNSEIWIYGSAYTTDVSRSNKQWLCEDNTNPPKAAAEYGSWYPLHPASKELAIPYSRVLGRLYERDAMDFFLKSSPDKEPDLDIGRAGLVEARTYSRLHDARMTSEPPMTWYWGDCRTDVLDMPTVNGVVTTKHDPDRDMKDARKKIKILEGLQGSTGHRPPLANTARDRGLRRFMAPILPLRPSPSRETSLTIDETESSSPGTEEKGQKRIHTSEEDSDEEHNREDVFQHETKIIEQAPGTSTKKTKVLVVIDD